MARGAFPDVHPLCLGMPGMHGNATAVTALQKADLLIALGSRFDDRVTGKVRAFAPEAKIIHVDIDPAEQGKVRRPDVPIVGDCRLVIEELDPGDPPPPGRRRRAGRHGGRGESRISGWRELFPLTYEQSEPGEALKPQFCLEHLRDSAPEGTILVSGVGQHQMWASQYWRFEQPYTWVNSGGLGTMGFSVPAAIGAKVGRPDRTVWAVDGDGCFQMTAQELVTASTERIPVKVAILNNSYLGMVRQWQEMFYDERYSEVYLSPDLPDYVKWAEAMGCVGHPRRVARGGPARDRQGQRDRRPPGRGRVPRRRAREGVPDGARRPVQRRHRPPRGQPTSASDARRRPSVSSLDSASSLALRSAVAQPQTASTRSRTTSCRCSSRTGRACWPGCVGLFARRGYNIFSLAVAPTEDERFSRITIVVDVESAPLEQIVKQLFKLIDVVKITELDPAPSVERELLLATVRADSEMRGQVVELVQIFEGRILAVGPGRAHGVAGGRTRQAGRLRGAPAPLWHRGAAAHGPGRTAQARTRQRAHPRR